MSAGAKRVAARKTTLTHEAVCRAPALRRPYCVWDDRVIGFGLRVSPGGTKSFFVQYRTGGGRRTDANRKTTLGRFPRLSPVDARKRAQALIGSVRDGADPSRARARARALPTLGEAGEAWLRIKEPHVAGSTLARYRYGVAVALGAWRSRRLDRLTREDVATRFDAMTLAHGKASANLGMNVLGAVYRRAAVDHPGLRDPVARWKNAGGRVHAIERRRIEAPSELLPAWAQGIEHCVRRPELRDVFWFAMYTGMRLGEVLGLRWDRVDSDTGALRVEHTKSGEPLILPITRQLDGVLLRRWEASVTGQGAAGDPWVFASPEHRAAPVRSPAKSNVQKLYRAISCHAGTKFWFHGLRNAFITVALHDEQLSRSLVKRLVNHAPAPDVTQGYAAQWTLEQLRAPAQRIADRIDALIAAGAEAA